MNRMIRIYKKSRFICHLLCNFFGILFVDEPIIVCVCWIMSIDSRYDHENFLRVCHTFYPKKQVGIALAFVAFHTNQSSRVFIKVETYFFFLNKML